MLAVEHVEWQGKRIDAIDTTEIGAIMIGDARRGVKGIDPAVFTKIVPRGFCSELIQPERAFLRVDMKIPRCNRRR